MPLLDLVMPPLPGPSSFRIMRRDPSLGTRGIRAGATGPGEDGSGSEPGKKSRKDMTIEEREAAYREARDRIFGASLAESEEQSKPVGSSVDGTARSKGSAANSPSNARAGLGMNSATAGTPSSAKGSVAGPAPPQEEFRPSGAAINPYAASGMPPLPYQSTYYDANGALFGAQQNEPGRYAASTTGFDREPVWPQLTPQQQQQPPFHTPPWSQYQQHAQQQMPLYSQNGGSVPQAMYQYPYPQPSWQHSQQGGLYYAQNPSGNGSTSNLSSFDAFSPFPPTPSTNSSVGIPSPAPSVSGSSNSAVSRRGGRGNVEGDAQRRGSRASSSSESLSVSRAGATAGTAQSGFPSLPHGRQQQQQQQFGDLQASSVSTSRSASPASMRLQPTDGRRIMTSAGNGSSGRLNVGDRSLFDPNRTGGGAGESSTQGRSARVQHGAEAATLTTRQHQHQQQNIPHYAPQQTVIGGGYAPLPWPPSTAPFVPSQQQQGVYQQQLPLAAMGYYGLPSAVPVSDMPLRYPTGVASPPALTAGLHGRPLQHTIGSSSIRLGSVIPAQAVPTSPVVASEGESTQHGHQQGQVEQGSVAGTISPPPASIPGLPARPDWVLGSLNAPHDVRSAALASLPGNAQSPNPATTTSAATASKANEVGVSAAPGALEPGSLATTPRSSVRSLNGYVMSDRAGGDDEFGSSEARQEERRGGGGALLLSDKMARAGLSNDVDVDVRGNGDEKQDEGEEGDDDDESAESSSLGPSASASNVGGDDESEGAPPAGDNDEDEDEGEAAGEADGAGGALGLGVRGGEANPSS
ncbi:hypothetical protein BCV69DRAFT_90919 [Microstroma glucosiphilum]|uniref:SUZ domain-containing protein n=1 Tax=Pseudomicrostroma glucosiphilum TaxID=1684307 RepID=A0A316TZA4_9BASI|nr:hypothetical protein BCV69DRAFT_90919 [Pseudomicrostroma glucosiphilum]PWN17998.1 hypothetical protein BCV69DRAFT_90919 [Pseudomicrostroma glucosiphilum]